MFSTFKKSSWSNMTYTYETITEKEIPENSEVIKPMVLL
jgi:hypothetical protein